jgi:hypothetical protein
LIVYEDSRQKVGKHDAKHAWFEAHGIEVVRKKLDAGDYATDQSNILVDTKKGLAEVAMDVGRDHKRFAREMERARDAGCRLVILVEVGAPYRTTQDVSRWVNDACKRCDWYRRLMCDPAASGQCRRYRAKPMRGTTMARIIQSMETDYGCRFEYVNPRYSARRICELLGVNYE